MPVQFGRNWARWGDRGHKYPFSPGNPQSRGRAGSRAARQGRAIEASKHSAVRTGSRLSAQTEESPSAFERVDIVKKITQTGKRTQYVFACRKTGRTFPYDPKNKLSSSTAQAECVAHCIAARASSASPPPADNSPKRALQTTAPVRCARVFRF